MTPKKKNPNAQALAARRMMVMTHAERSRVARLGGLAKRGKKSGKRKVIVEDTPPEAPEGSDSGI